MENRQTMKEPAMTQDRIAVASLTPLKLPESAILKPTKIETAEFASSLEEMLKGMYTRPVNYDTYAGNQPYATVKVNGKTVATVYNNGSLETSNALGAKLGRLPSDGTGPSLAQARAEYMAKLTGGAVEKAKSAITAGEYSKLPPMKFVLDEAAMKQDSMYGMLQALLAQQEV